MQIFIVTSTAGPNRDLSKDTREQPFWDDHAAFIAHLGVDVKLHCHSAHHRSDRARLPIFGIMSITRSRPGANLQHGPLRPLG